MHWSDEGIVINIKRFGENRLIVSILTSEHGLHMGLVRQNSKNISTFQPGVLLKINWCARLIDHLGTWAGEISFTPLADVFHDNILLAALNSACALIEISLPEREPHLDIYQALQNFIRVLGTYVWIDAYIQLESILLKNAGLSLDFTCCAATGSQENLIYVSPRTGRAVSQTAGQPYHDKLLPLPDFLIHSVAITQARSSQDILKALEMTEFFLVRFILDVHHLKMPNARNYLKNKFKIPLPIKKI